jgi:hypothetical protein
LANAEKRREEHKIQETEKIEKTQKKYIEWENRAKENAKRIKEEKIKKTEKNKEYRRECVS